MMKFFRKHMKELLAVFMCLLLVAWLGGSALTSILHQDASGADLEIGQLFGRPVLQRDVWSLTHDLELLNQMGMGGLWQMPWIYTMRTLGIEDPGVLRQYIQRIRQNPEQPGWPEPLTEMEWFILTMEARENKVYAPAGAVEAFKKSFNIDADQVAARLAMYRRTAEDINQAIRAFLLVHEQTFRACNGVRVSEADVRHFVRQSKEQARVKVVVLPASEFLDESYEPTEAELIEQYEAGKDTASQPAGGLDFGYQLPEAAQIEYVKISVDPLVPRQTVSDERAMQYWREHKDEFRRPDTQPSEPADPRMPPPARGEPYETFTEARAAVAETLMREAARREALRIAENLIEHLERAWRDAPTTQPGGCKQPPASETGDDVYPNLIARWEEKWPGVLTYHGTELLDKRALGRDQALRDVMAMRGTPQEIRMADAAFLVAGLEGDPQQDKDHGRFYRNVYRTCAAPFTDRQGNAYVMRTVAARPKQSPDSMEAVREQLVRDIRLKRAYEAAEQAARELKEHAAGMGLAQALTANESLSERLGERALQEPQPFTRMRALVYPGMPPYILVNSVPGLGGDPDLAKACFELARETTTQASAVLVHEQRRQQRWVVAELVEILPPTEAEFEEERPVAIEYYLRERQVSVLSEWFDADNIRARVNWKDLHAAPQPPADGEPAGAG